MKRFCLPLAALLLSACSGFPFQGSTAEADAARAAAAATAARRAQPSPLAGDGTARVAIDGVEIEKVAFRAGISSATVEHLAKRRACTGGLGAGLVTEPGPVEVYRMACDNGKVFMARCELRQCKPM